MTRRLLGRAAVRCLLGFVLWSCGAAAWPAIPDDPLSLRNAQHAPIVVLTAASAVEDASQTPPPDDAPWRPVTLPDNWHRSRPGFSGTVWYRVPFNVRADADVTHLLYMPRTSATRLLYWINGHRLSFSVSYGDPRFAELQRPQSYTVPSFLLHPGENRIYVRVTGQADYRHGLTRIYTGWGTGVKLKYYEPRFALQVLSTAVFGGMLLIVGLLSFILWQADRTDPVLFWFGLTALASAFWSALQMWPPEFTDMRLRDAVLYAVKYLYATPLIVLCLRFGRVRHAVGERLLWALFAAGCLGAYAVRPEHYPTLATAALMLYIALFVLFLGWLCMRFSRLRQWRAYLLALALAAVVVVHGYDLARWMGYADFDQLLLTPYALFFLIVALGATVVDRHLAAVRELDRSRRTLEREVAVKMKEVETMLREQAVLRERQRIMADMHDGLGSSLVSLLSLAQSGRVTARELEQRLNASLIELRAIVDSLEPVEGDLAAVLGNVRYRMRGAIEQSGARFVWDVPDLPRLEGLTPEVILSIERILLEVLSNALQHAGARTIVCSAHVTPGDRSIAIRVADDGTGFDPATHGPGRGLRGMSERARRAGLGVDLATRKGGQGTVVTLTVPLRLPSAAEDAPPLMPASHSVP